ncbi:DUF998 domain-containing protein [Microbacterium sp. Marseille-Q6648]|uniref:DUF998 domain-containing protein n=1 Tax=Microbacterium sp. Marseille-Q6648 TaxID=2937991 RepID=UPI0020417E2D|nr:DUF998 domain-containing protein [Microbacterium sp. Marseille-Q6648]
MTAPSPTSPAVPASSGAPPARPTLRAESEAVYAALGTGVVGALWGLIVALIWPALPLSGEDWSFGTAAAIGAAIVAGAASGTGYWRSRGLTGQEWRLRLSSWKFTVNTTSVVVVHVVLAALATLVVYLVLSRGFIGLGVSRFWSITLMAITLGLTAYLVYLSVSRIDTQRMSSLLMAFIVIGTLTAMVTTPDPQWWMIHFSHLGSFWALSSLVFNGTLIAGGLLVTTFAVYIAADMESLVAEGKLARTGSPRFVSVLFVVMGIMLACVGIFPVNVNLLLHNLSAMGMAVMFLVLLASGPRMLRGMPRTYFLSSWAFLAALVVSLVLFVAQYFSLTAFEIIVFALIFGWIAVFIRFLGVTGQPDSASTRRSSARPPAA